MFTLGELRAAATLVHGYMPPTPQFAWPLLAQRLGVETIVKHENHTPVGAFKIRGGLVYMDSLKRERPGIKGVATATRGNHGQSMAFAGRAHGVPVTVFVPRGNSTEKNAAMRALGAELIEHGADFDEARQYARAAAAERGLEMAPSFHPDLVCGVATYALEMFEAFNDLDAIYAPIGLGSGICGIILARDLLGLKTHVIGVSSENAPAYALSFKAGRVIETNSALTFADGMATRIPDAQALGIIRAGAERIVEVSDGEIAAAIRVYHEDTHNMAEGAGAAPLAALMKEREDMRGKRVGVVLTGGNIDRGWAAEVLSGRTPNVV